MSLELPLPTIDLPEEELGRRFDVLQEKLRPLWKAIQSFEDDVGEQTIIVVPSLTVEFASLQGSVLQAYEERFLFLLLLLRQPNARLVYVTSQPIHHNVIEYYLGLLPGVISSHARQRLFLLSPHDGAPQPLSIKLLQRPKLLRRIRALIKDPDRAHLVPFNTTRYERDLALRLGIPMFGADPRHLPLGTKSGCRKLFRAANVPLPAGFEDVRGFDEVVAALQRLCALRPGIRQAMVKHDEGVSGEGNAVVDLQDVDATSRDAIGERVRAMRLEAKHMTFESFMDTLGEGGIIEERLRGERFTSPSVQMRTTPLGDVELLSTHDQLLGGTHGQKYLGCLFPADVEYATTITEEAQKVGHVLAKQGVLGRFAVDFVCVQDKGTWHPYAIELNLRKGGTTHPFLTLQFLTDGTYRAEQALFVTRSGQSKYYVATDSLASEVYRVFTPDDVFDLAVRHGLHFDQRPQTGVVFHMMSAVGDHGRLGFTAIADTRGAAANLYQRTIDVLDREAEQALRHAPM